MRGTRWLAIAALSVLGVFAVFLGGAAERVEAQSYEAAELETVELINAYRQENGLGALSLSAPLSVASERHSEDMGTYGFFAHDTVQSSYYQPGWGHSERIAQEGYDSNTFTAENLAFGQATPQEVFEAWRNSPSHNAAMLGDYSVVGIGLANIGGVPYWTTVFGAEADASAQPVGSSSETPSETTPAEEPPAEEPPAGEPPAGDEAAQAEQFAETTQDQTIADEQYGDTADEAIAVEEQYDAEPTAAGEQYDAPESADETVVSERDGGIAAAAPAELGASAAEQYLANAESLRAAAAQYGEVAREAEAEIAALQAAQAEPSAAQAAAPATAAAEAPASSPSATSVVGVVSPEPQIAAPASETQEIPVPDAIEGGAVQSAGQSGDGSPEGSEQPSEAMAAVGMTVLPDTGGIPLGGILGASLAVVACVLMTVRRFIR